MIKRNINTRWEDIKVITRLRRIKLKLLRRFKLLLYTLKGNVHGFKINGLESLKIALKRIDC